MNDEDLEKLRDKLRKLVANKSHILSIPIDFDQLIKDGVLKKIGKSYYVVNLKKLPENAKESITSISKTRHGLKVTFSKGTKSMKKLADKFTKNRD